jgi:hypothetical protein
MNDNTEDFDSAQSADQPEPQQQADVFTRATEALQFGTSEEARSGLIEAMRTVAGHDQNLRAVQEEHAATQQYLEDLARQNPGLANDTLAVAVIRQHTFEQQLQDLVDTGTLNLEEYRKQSGGHDPDPAAVATAHEGLRAGKVQGVKTRAQLMDNALDALERLNVRRSGRGLDESRGQVVDDRINRQAVIQGRPRIRYSHDSNDSAPPTPVADASPESMTRAYMGEPQNADTRPDNRAAAVARMISDRAHKAYKRPDHFTKKG